MIRDHIQASHQTMGIDSCIIRIVTSSTKGSSIYSEPDAAISVSESSHGEPDQESTNERQQDVIDLTKQNQAQEQAMQSKPSQTMDEQRGSDKNRIRNMLSKMQPSDLRELANDIKMNLENNSPESTRVSSLTATSNDSVRVTPGASVPGSSPDKNTHSLRSRAAGGQLERNFPSGSTSKTIADSVVATKPENPPRFDSNRSPLSNEQPPKGNEVPTEKAQKTQIESTTINTDGNEIPPLRTQGRKIGLQRHMLLGPMLQGPMDVQLPGQPTASTGRAGNPYRPIGSDRKRLIGVINEAPVDPPPKPPQQQQQQQPSLDTENSNNNIQQVPTSSSSQRRPTASIGRPGNPHRLIGSDRKKLIGVINDAPVDPQQKLPQQQQQQQHSNPYLENYTNNVQDKPIAFSSQMRPTASTGRPGNRHRPIGSDRKRLIGVINDAPVDPIQQPQEQQHQQKEHSSLHPENPNSNIQQSTSSSSQMRPTASIGRPGNPDRLIGSDRKRLIGVINDAPVDPPQPQQQQQQNQSTSSKELHNRNEERECVSATKPEGRPRVQQKLVGMERHNLLAASFGASPGGPFVGPRGPNVVMICEIDMSQYQQRLNELITITQPNKHGWEVMEFQQKFTEYLIAPENDYKEIIKILKNKKILGKKFSCIDDFKQIVSDDLDAISIKIMPPSITLEQKQKQEAASYRATLQQETVIPGPTPQKETTIPTPTLKEEAAIPTPTLQEVIYQNAAYCTNKQLREAQRLAPEVMKEGVKPPSITQEQIQAQETTIGKTTLLEEDAIPRSTIQKVIDDDAAYLPNKQLREAQKVGPKIMMEGVESVKEVSSQTTKDNAETILEKTTESLISEKTGSQIHMENKKQVSQLNNTTLMLEPTPKQTVEEVLKPDTTLMQGHALKQTVGKVREDDAAFLTGKQLQRNTSEEHISKQTPSTGRPGNPYKRIGSDRKKLIGILNEAPVDPEEPTLQKAGVTLIQEPIPEQTLQKVLETDNVRQEHIPKQTLWKVREDDAVFLTEKQLQRNTSEEHISKQTPSAGRPGNPYKRIGSDRKKLVSVLNEAPVDVEQPTPQKAGVTLIREPIPEQTLQKVLETDNVRQEHIPKQTLGKVREDDAAFLTEKQLQRNTSEEHISKQTPSTGRPGNPYKRIGSDRKKLVGVLNEAPVDPKQPTPQKAGVTLIQGPVPKQTLQNVLETDNVRHEHIPKQTLGEVPKADAEFLPAKFQRTKEQIENEDVKARKMNLSVFKPRVDDDESKKLQVPKPSPQPLHSWTPPREDLLRIQEQSSLTSTPVITSRSQSETVTSGPKSSPNSDFHHPHGGLCTLIHPPGESCPVNMQKKYQQLKGIGKPRQTGHQCDLCGETIEGLWRMETHKEKIHGIKIPKLATGVATSGTEDKTKDIGEHASKNTVLKSHATGPDSIESADTVSNKTGEIQERKDDRSLVDSASSSVLADRSKIPVSVIELLDKGQPVPSENINKQGPSPVPEKDGIRGALFGESSATAKTSGLSHSAVTVGTTSTAPVSFTPSLTLPLSMGSSSTSPLEMLATFTSSEINHSQVTGRGVQLALPPTVYSVVQLGNQLTNPAVISITPPVARLKEAIQTVANAAMSNITGDGITLHPPAQRNAPIQSTTPITQVQPETQTVTVGDPDVECIGSVETRPSGLKLLVPEVQPRDKPKTVKDLLGLQKKQRTEGNDLSAAAARSIFDDSMMTGLRKRGRPRTTLNKAPADSESCKICGKEKTTVRGQPHKCLVHSCIWCDTSFDTAQQLMDHVKNTHPQKSVYECRVCGKGFNVKGTLERHMFVHSKKKEYKCNICKLAFTQSNNLKRHIAIHTGQKAFKCGECDKAFTSKYNLSQHLLVHFPKRTTYSCRFCKKSFLFARTRDKHEFTHFGFTELQCSKCQKKFPSLPSLEAHIDIYHGGVGEGEACFYECDTKALKSSDPSMTSNKKQRKHICPICNQNFFFLLHLQEHMQSHKVPDSDLYACTKCDARFPSSEALRAHIDTHSPLHCSECDETFTFDTQKAAHKLTHHSSGDGAQVKE